MNKKNNRKGFTIVELVIVIAVIAILATVLVPTFGDVITRANETAAKQEAKNIYTNYVVAVADDGAYVEDGFIVVDEYYVEIESGAVTGISKTAPVDCYYNITSTGATWTEGSACTQSAVQGHTCAQ